MKRFLLVLICFSSFFLTAQDPCDDLEIVSVNFDPLTMESIVIEVANSSSEIFSYPGWRVYDENENLIGEEEVNFFGIGESSVHAVPHELDIEPGESLSLILELWTGFYDTLVCTFEGDFVLQPTEGCAELLFSYSHLDELSVAQDVVYTIQSDEGEIVATDQVSLAGGFDYQIVEQCLAPDCYTITYSPAGQLFQSPVGVTITYQGWFQNVPVSDELNTADPQVVLEFGVWDDCEGVVESIAERQEQEVSVYPNPAVGPIVIEGLSGRTTAIVYDLQGHRITEKEVNSGRADISDLSAGYYLIRILKDNQALVARLIIQD